MPKQRVSLLDRQNALLAKEGFSAPTTTATTSTSRGGRSKGFDARQEAHLLRQGRSNATSASRATVEWGGDGDDGNGGGDANDDGASVAPSIAASVAPSLHPSMAGSTVSRACSEVTIGAGDDTGYWDFCHRTATKKDLGHTCRECKRPFSRIGEALTERRGARTSSRYHAECFSGFADPRSQAGSSFHEGRLAGSQLSAAPQLKAGSKMRVSRHFDGGSDSRYRRQQQRGAQGPQGGSLGKISAFSGGNGFGARSGKNRGGAQPGPGGEGFGGLEHDLSGFEDLLITEGKEDEEKAQDEDEDEDERGAHRDGGAGKEEEEGEKKHAWRTAAGAAGGRGGGLNASMLAEHQRRMATEKKDPVT